MLDQAVPAGTAAGHRDPMIRLSSLLDAGSLRPLDEPDSSGVRAVRGRIDGADVFAYCTDTRVIGGAMTAAGGAAYGPALTDLVIMSAAGRIFVTGTDVVRSVTGVPRVTVITRKGIAVMDAEAAVGILHRKRLAAAPEGERAGLKELLVQEHEITAGGAGRAVRLGLVDEVIDPAQTRRKLVEASAAAPPGRGQHGNIPL